jgi:hypothetical protein
LDVMQIVKSRAVESYIVHFKEILILVYDACMHYCLP